MIRHGIAINKAKYRSDIPEGIENQRVFIDSKVEIIIRKDADMAPNR